jgi:hypothetical protein
VTDLLADLREGDEADRLGSDPPDAILASAFGSAVPLNLTDGLTAATLDRTLDGASTLSLTVFDPHGVIVGSKAITKALDLNYAGQWWRLVKMTKSQASVTLTFEDRAVAYLRRHTKARKVSRNTMTRAQFARSLVREVKEQPIAFVCPEINERQPVGTKKADNKTPKRSGTKRAVESQKGLAADADSLTVKGVRATRIQRSNMQRVLDVADTLGAGPKATKALVMAVTQESGVMNLTGGDSSSVGILQLLNTWYGGSTAVRGGRRDIEKVCRDFLRSGFAGFGGAMSATKTWPTYTAAEIAAHVQCNAGGPPDYAPWADEADRWIAAYGSGDGDRATSTQPKTYTKRYEFRRGEPGQPEDSWTCLQRLAEEVRWRCFMDKGRLYFMSEDRLVRARPAMTVNEGRPGVDWVDFDVDAGKATSSVQITCRAELWVARIGAVVMLEDIGPVVDGRWLVSEISQDLFDTAATITLKSREHKLPEPASETVSRAATASASADSGALRDRIVAVARASMESYNKNPGAWFYNQGGRSNADDPTKPPRSGSRSDCSQWVAAVYKKAGAPSPCSGDYATAYTGNMKVKGHAVGMGDLKPGDVVIYGKGSGHHVELYVGPGDRTIGHGSAPVDYGTTGMQSEGQGWRYSFLDDA